MLIRESLANFFVKLQHPNYSRHQVETIADGWDAPFCMLAVYHKIKFHHWDEQGFTVVGGVLDCIHVQPNQTNKQGSTIPGRFDTVIFKDLESANQDRNGVNGEHLSTNAPLPTNPLVRPAGGSCLCCLFSPSPHHPMFILNHKSAESSCIH